MDHKSIISYDPQHETYNVDIVPSKAGKDGAAQWLVKHLRSQGQAFDAALVADDSANGLAALEPESLQEREKDIAEVILVAPANAQPEVFNEVAKHRDKYGVAAFIPEQAPFASEKGGAGAVLTGLQETIRERVQEQSQDKARKDSPPEHTLTTNGHQLNGKLEERARDKEGGYSVGMSG
jgi:hypothetical protein